MKKTIVRYKYTSNLKQFKKYIDHAIEYGADQLSFENLNGENPYFIFEADLTREEEREFEIDNMKEEFLKKLSELEKTKLKTHYFRMKLSVSIHDINRKIDEFKIKNKIGQTERYISKQVICDDYDDFEDNMQTIFLTEIINPNLNFKL